MTLQMADLWAGYGDAPVLRGVSLQVKAGEVVALVGPNGAGKTTLLRVVGGVLQPLRGEVTWEGRPLPAKPRERARIVAVVPQAQDLPLAFTVGQTVMLGRTPYLSWLGAPGMADHRAVQRALQQTDLLPLADRLLAHLSGGERQRVLLARALAQQTPLMLLDEPTAHLDLRHQTRFLRLVHHLARESGLTVLMVLHDLNLAARFADRVALFAQGRVVAFGAPGAVLSPTQLAEVYGVEVEVFSRRGRPVVIVP